MYVFSKSSPLYQRLTRFYEDVTRLVMRYCGNVLHPVLIHLFLSDMIGCLMTW